MLGENFVTLIGKLSRPSFKLVGQGNYPMFKANLAIPTEDKKTQYIKISAWYSNAEALNEVSPTTFIKVHGHIEESSFDGKCRHCNGPERKYWTEVVVDNFIEIGEK